MPFDGTNFHAAEIAVLDKMAEILATPERWCKGSAFYPGADGSPGARCLVGAISHVCTGADFASRKALGVVADTVFSAMEKAIPGITVMYFNDLPGTTHQDILDLIAKTRASFS